MAIRSLMTNAAIATKPQGAVLQSIFARVARSHAVQVSRRELAELDGRLLRDIGLSPVQARDEANRPAWDVRPKGRRWQGPERKSWLESRMETAKSGIRTAMRRWRTRQSIADLDQYSLRDIGVSFAEAEQEANKPFWRR
jgi:uncharacterized protein YjiS (DUF1127 family)